MHCVQFTHRTLQDYNLQKCRAGCPHPAACARFHQGLAFYLIPPAGRPRRIWTGTPRRRRGPTRRPVQWTKTPTNRKCRPAANAPSASPAANGSGPGAHSGAGKARPHTKCPRHNPLRAALGTPLQPTENINPRCRCQAIRPHRRHIGTTDRVCGNCLPHSTMGDQPSQPGKITLGHAVPDPLAQGGQAAAFFHLTLHYFTNLFAAS